MNSLPRLIPALLFVLAALSCAQSSAGTVVLYTSLDQPISEPILREFEAQTGIRVLASYDVEAAKTTGLVSRLAAERGNPRADVFWSSEYAQTLLLKDDGLLASYDSPEAVDIPDIYRDPDRYWTGFGARARVILVNTKLVPAQQFPRSVFDLVNPAWGDGEVAIANPLFGTTSTHAAALFAVLGPEKAKGLFEQMRARGFRVVDGNSVVRDMVASGEVKAGITDTDDANEAVTKGAPVAVIFPDQGDGGLGTLVIPNTVALTQNAPHPAAGKRLIDFLLSREVEASLAKSGSLQMPVRDGVPAPPEVPPLGDIRAMSVSPAAVAGQFSASSTWIKETFLR
ncbi:MAG: extracellular solute-binding protein [Dehalococcoidia bacterium]|nr:extracellular solute-binding protein [Dehalococcoidia bacterium]